MMFNLSGLLSGEQRTLDIAFTLDISDLSDDITQGKARFEGRCTDCVGYIELALTAYVECTAVCARCAEPFVYREQYSFAPKLVPEGTKNEEDEYFIITGGELDADALGRELLLYEIPMVLLCSKDCKGLCPKCGVNKNKADCSCSLREPDARLSKLAQLAEKLKNNND